MANLFSHPAYYPSGNYTVTGYNLVVSRASGNSPNPYGPWTAVTGYSNYTSNLDILDTSGTKWDMYRVAPIITMNATGASVTLDFSRPFYAWTPLYDSQISSLLDNFRRNYLNDPGIEKRDSTVPQESTGSGVMPFITDSSTSRFYLSFLPNDNPIKIDGENLIVMSGSDISHATALTPYTDYYPSEAAGYIDFASIPTTNNYLRVDYKAYRYTNDECRNMLTNAVSVLSLYGINGYEVRNSNNLFYLTTPLPNRDMAEILCEIAYRNLLNSQVESQLETAESWKDGKVEFTSDPSRSLQAATMHVANLEESIRNRANSYIYNTRTYISRGEFSSFFDVTGILPLYTLIVAGANTGVYAGWWL